MITDVCVDFLVAQVRAGAQVHACIRQYSFGDQGTMIVVPIDTLYVFA